MYSAILSFLFASLLIFLNSIQEILSGEVTTNFIEIIIVIVAILLTGFVIPHYTISFTSYLGKRLFKSESRVINYMVYLIYLAASISILYEIISVVNDLGFFDSGV